MEPNESLMAGFESDEPTAIPPAPEDEQAPQEAPETAAPAEPPPEYVQITRADFERIQQAASRLPEIEQTFTKRFDTAFGKIGGIERNLQQGGYLPEADLAPFKEDLPELYTVLSKLRAPADFGTALKEQTAALRKEIGEELRKEMVATVHPDWAEFTQGEHFAEWVKTKDQTYVDRLNQAWEPGFIASAITEAKQWKPPKARAARTEELEAAIQPRGTGGSAPAGKTAIDYFNEGFNE